MKPPACVLILLRLYVLVRPSDFSVFVPQIPHVHPIPNYQKSSEICFINNKPFPCSKVPPSSPNIKPYGINTGRERVRYNQEGSYPIGSNVLRRPPLYTAHKNLFSSFQYQPKPEIHGSLLYNPSPLERGKYNYVETTTLRNAIRPLPDLSILPLHGIVVDVSESTTKYLIASVSKPNRENKVSANVSLFDKFILSLDRFENKFFKITFNKLLSISPPNRLENGISFAQSGLFLYLALMALSTEVDSVSSGEINSNLRLQSSNAEKIKLLRQIVSWLPSSSSKLKFRWATRLVLEPGLPVSEEFLNGSAAAMRLQVEWLNGTETLENLTTTLNSRIKTDSGGAMRNTFDEDDFTEGTCSILLNTIYVRARWRSPPTVLNGTRPFRDSEHDEPQRSVRMIRINDLMRYAALKEWNAEALEISYATRDLTLLLLIPEGHTLKSLVTNITTTSLRKIDDRLRTMRLAAILPIYTLRMTLLLPGKLQEMGISRLVETNYTQNSGCGQLRLSHAVQRIMFWAEAGRNAYKDDGIEWDEAPEKEIMVDRPYLFYVRWKNVTLMNGNFVL